ncbi:hypothetical protein GYMLUDRAFT_60722 [Collybiopsis luxurians FD-317 M1]|uniref:Uncharacterized protein n=1 Tax=Collybiopsis luxurians FD-317 M1 TaxID=944289 RepID=A0A0D0CS07_9AGAR|nr:hypothetical protein GYMLUDRAFT_60722 [Collybiopsis luxurians FD-317 M1]
MAWIPLVFGSRYTNWLSSRSATEIPMTFLVSVCSMLSLTLRALFTCQAKSHSMWSKDPQCHRVILQSAFSPWPGYLSMKGPSDNVTNWLLQVDIIHPILGGYQFQLPNTETFIAYWKGIAIGLTLSIDSPIPYFKFPVQVEDFVPGMFLNLHPWWSWTMDRDFQNSHKLPTLKISKTINLVRHMSEWHLYGNSIEMLAHWKMEQTSYDRPVEECWSCSMPHKEVFITVHGIEQTDRFILSIIHDVECL